MQYDALGIFTQRELGPVVEEIGGRLGAALWLRAEEILAHCSSEPGIIASTGHFHTGMLSSAQKTPLSWAAYLRNIDTSAHIGDYRKHTRP